MYRRGSATADFRYRRINLFDPDSDTDLSPVASAKEDSDPDKNILDINYFPYSFGIWTTSSVK